MSESVLSQDELDALLMGVGTDEEVTVETEEESGVHNYDLTAHERIVRRRMPTLEIINERFTRLLRIGLLNFLRRTADVAVSPIRMCKYGEFARELTTPTSLNLVHFKPLRGAALIVFEPDLVCMVVDNLFGGDGRFNFRAEGREFTQTEQRISRRVLDIVFDSYGKSWESVYPLEFEFIRAEMQTQFANIATPNEVVVVTSLTITVGVVSAQMHICTPYAMVEPIRDVLASTMQSETMEVDERWVKMLSQQVQNAIVELVAQLGTTRLRIGDITRLKAGDVLPLSIPQTVQATVNGVPVFECSYGISNRKYALRVERMLTQPSSEPTPRDQNA